ncbi:MAG: hypothetical protein KKA62_02150 [Nanoarchaeota archaeon]|nr:hypothetical protein [Nanoarchaeota archaeon]MBU1644204.1 hypothetical protein [Nanoarchaeota archaeon]MBU1976737.1 hypothetical protein [Nanoarchaeota archaeon]
MERKVISFDDLIEKVLDRAELAISKNNFSQARQWYEKACNLYSQHPTGNLFIESRKYDLYLTLFER